ncbi:alpha/beta fold hydrolase [Krasilnikoviella flava]|uniref:Pimeloyl-ACP methyl ester carboxylesterase n=1 Tax=Krasilnikoviella flava TaxID=526729 RepID=A0A1T5K9L1_9MICO|nr:alpha/beta fold hydrolase [Krasilnikoviella flava]SKC60366.1 Pimeloyl-ACP methyl ester carboxylesterase [Krasilnikoviella flava]
MPHAIADDGAEIAYQVRGAGPALVLLAGQANSHRWWDPVRDRLGAGRRTITLDWRGTGTSGPTDRELTTRRLAGDVAAVLDDLRLECSDVYGTSMGGRVAQWFAVDHPRRLGRLVLGCTTPGGAHAVERSTEVRRAMVQPDRGAARRSLLDLMYTPAWLAAHPGPTTVEGDPSMTPQARRDHLRASDGHDAWDHLPQVLAPTLVLHGADDVLAPAVNAGLLGRRVPGARVEVLPGLRHAYFHEGEEVATPLVREFLG